MAKKKTTAEVPAPNPIQIPRTEKYLRNRPFLLITMVQRPAKNPKTGENIRTEEKGWMEVAGNLSTFENPVLVDRVNDTHLRNCNVIIDVINGKCIKNAFNGTPDIEVVNHYLEKYRQQVTESMEVWLNQVAGRVAEKQAAAVDAVYTLAD